MLIIGIKDSYGAQRKEKMQNTMSLYRCHTIFNVRAYPASFLRTSPALLCRLALSVKQLLTIRSARRHVQRV